MSKIPSEIGFVSSRRGFLKRGLGLGVGGLVAGCGRTVLGGSGGPSVVVASGSGPGPNNPTDPPTPPNPPTPPDPPTPVDTQPPLSNPVQVNASVTSTQLGVVGTDFVGFSFEKSELPTTSFQADKTNIVNLFKALGPSIVRIGGSAVDRVVWTTDLKPSHIDRFAAFISQTGWRVIYGIGLLTNTPDAAANEAQYVISKMGNSITHLTLGNEPDNTSYGSSPSFNTKWLAAKNAIVNRIGNRAFAGPDATGSGTARDYTVPFAAAVGSSNITLLTHHFYTVSSADQTAYQAATTETVRDQERAKFRLTLLTIPTSTKLRDNLFYIKPAADSLNVKFRLTEVNSATGGGVLGVSDVYASVLWSLDFMFLAAQGGASGVNFHGGDKARYTPFTFSSASLLGVQPLYYGLLFFTMMGSGPVLSSSIDAGGKNISIYTIRTTSGYSVLLINKEENQSFEVTLNLPAPVSSATSIYLQGTSLLASLPKNIDNNTRTGVGRIAIQDGVVSNLSGKLEGMNPSYNVGISGSNPIIKAPPLTAVLVKLS